MLATNKLEIRTAPPTPQKSDRARTPAWVNRLLGVRPAPAFSIETEPQNTYPTVEGVSRAGAFRSYPR